MSRKKAIIAEVRNDDARSKRPARERLETSVLEELWSIWRADPRVPSIQSRRAWAIYHNANPRLVDSWFCRRRTGAKKAGQPIPGEPYDLPLDPPIAPKREQSTTPTEPELEAVPDLPSDDTLVYPPDDDYMDASSDTAFDEDLLVEPKRTRPPAYKEVPQPRPEQHHSQPKPRFDATLFPSADLYAGDDRCDDDVSYRNPSFSVCNQGQGKQSNFTCILCLERSDQGTPDEALSDTDAMFDARKDLFDPCPRLDFSPDALSELSAIPFLFRTPRTIPPDNAVDHRSVDNWSIIEDELGRLVNDGKLDFSFLDVPHLASMELLD